MPIATNECKSGRFGVWYCARRHHADGERRLFERRYVHYTELLVVLYRTLGRFFHYANRLMPNEFDPYREALVMEHATFWPEEFDDWQPGDRARVETALHSNPKDCAELTYTRQHTGFCRQITVTEADLERLAAR